jgi:hypothetical protein
MFVTREQAPEAAGNATPSDQIGTSRGIRSGLIRALNVILGVWRPVRDADSGGVG